MKYTRKDFPNVFQVLCKTKEEAKELIVFLNDELNVKHKYGSGGLGVKHPIYWNDYRHNTIYIIEEDSIRTTSHYYVSYSFGKKAHQYLSLEEFQFVHSLKETAYEIY